MKLLGKLVERRFIRTQIDPTTSMPRNRLDTHRA